MSGDQTSLFPSLPNCDAGAQSSKPKGDSVSRRTYISNLLVNESLQHLPAAVDHPTTEAFKAYLREHLHFNSANTRVRYAEHIAHRYSHEGKVNLALARVTQLDNYYQFALQGTGEERLEGLLRKWSTGRKLK